MTKWYILYGFVYKEFARNFLKLPDQDDDGSSALVQEGYGEKYLGLIRIDLDDIDPGAFFDTCPDATNYRYFVFWEVGIPYAKGFGFFDMGDENDNRENKPST